MTDAPTLDSFNTRSIRSIDLLHDMGMLAIEISPYRVFRRVQLQQNPSNRSVYECVSKTINTILDRFLLFLDTPTRLL